MSNNNQTRDVPPDEENLGVGLFKNNLTPNPSKEGKSGAIKKPVHFKTAKEVDFYKNVSENNPPKGGLGKPKRFQPETFSEEPVIYEPHVELSEVVEVGNKSWVFENDNSSETFQDANLVENVNSSENWEQEALHLDGYSKNPTTTPHSERVSLKGGSKNIPVNLSIFQNSTYPEYNIEKTYFPNAVVAKKRLKIQTLAVPTVFAVVGLLLFFVLWKVTQLWYVPVTFFFIQLLFYKFLSWRGGVAIRRMLSANTAHEVTAASQPGIFYTVHAIFAKMNIPIIPVWIVENSTPNAFVASLRRGMKVLVMTTGLLEIAKPDEFRGVIGHELGHVVNKDLEIRKMARLLSFEYFLSIFAKIVKKEKDPYSYKKANVASTLFDILRALSFFFLMVPLVVIRLLSLFASRSQEHLADLTSAEVLGGSNEIISGLRLLMRYEEAVRAKQRQYSGSNVSTGGGRFSQIASTHPHLKNRIKFLQKTCAVQITHP